MNLLVSRYLKIWRGTIRKRARHVVNEDSPFSVVSDFSNVLVTQNIQESVPDIEFPREAWHDSFDREVDAVAASDTRRVHEPVSLLRRYLLSVVSSKQKKAWSIWIGRLAKMKKLLGVLSRLMSKCKTMILRRSLRGWLKATQKMSRRGREFELGSKALTKMFASAREKSLRLAMRILERRTLKYKQSRINVRSSLLCMKDFFCEETC